MLAIKETVTYSSKILRDNLKRAQERPNYKVAMKKHFNMEMTKPKKIRATEEKPTKYNFGICTKNKKSNQFKEAK